MNIQRIWILPPFWTCLMEHIGDTPVRNQRNIFSSFIILQKICKNVSGLPNKSIKLSIWKCFWGSRNGVKQIYKLKNKVLMNETWISHLFKNRSLSYSYSLQLRIFGRKRRKNWKKVKRPRLKLLIKNGPVTDSSSGLVAIYLSDIPFDRIQLTMHSMFG